MTIDISAYHAFLPKPLLAALRASAEPVPAVPGLAVAPGLRTNFPEVETDTALAIAVEVFRSVGAQLHAVLEQRAQDRAFIDTHTAAAVAANRGRAIDDPDYATVLGMTDTAGRVVIGPLPDRPPLAPVEVPPFLAGEQITLFGPPDTARMAINAMNALHRQRPDEPAIVGELVEQSGMVPRWGADDEDSQTPIMARFLAACRNLQGCYDGTLTATHPRTGKRYTLAETGRSLPIKRIPGLALPDGSHLLDGQPLPLHLFDLTTHVWHNRHRPEALVFYVPKLENEEEAAYLRALLDATETAVRTHDPGCALATTKVLLVFENPRAIFRIEEMAAALGPHFLGGSLGWHDYLGSTARLFKNDPNYRIPVKADPEIVIKHIKESHRVLARTMAPIGGLAIGGMYGVLFEEGDERSFLVSMHGYIKDVITQLRRGLNGFWVAHPDFVRAGIALVAAWRRREADPEDGALDELVCALVPDADELSALRDFIARGDVPSLSPDDPAYPRALLAANIAPSEKVPNHHPDEVRYNVFQALQYLAAWLTGVGCVALPATLQDARGQSVFVRIMDDLATTERSRWELWAEVRHGRVSRALFEQILREEHDHIRAGHDSPTRRIQVRWEGETARWYPVAVALLHQLVTDPEPVEFVPELTLPFTFPVVRDAAEPWQAARQLCPGRYAAPSTALDEVLTTGGPA